MPDLGSFSVLGRGGDAKHPVSVFFFAPVLKFQASIPFSYHHSEFFFGPLLLHFQGL